MTDFIGKELLSIKWYLLVGAALIIFFVWWKKREQNKSKKDIPCFSTIPLLTTLLKIFLYRPKEQLETFYPSDYLIPALAAVSHLYWKEKVLQGFWAGHTYILCFEATISEKIFQSSVALNKDWLYKLLHPWLGMGLLTSGDEKWRMRRKMLTPAFHFRILKDFLGIFNEQTKILIQNIKKLHGEVIDITSVVALCTLDIIGESAMGVHLNAQRGDGTEYVNAVKHLTSATVKPFTTPWFWIPFFYYLSSTGKKTRKYLAIVHNFARDVIRKRKEKFIEDEEIKEVIDDFEDFPENVARKKRRPFLDLLLYHHLTDNSISEEDIREEVDTFTFEAHDTTSMTISWALYLLGWHKDIQENVYRELQQIYGEDREKMVTTEDLKEMKYLECVIKETLRLYPAVPFIIRRTSKDIEADEYIIPANSSIAIFIYAIHRDPSIYPNPEVFDPDRFLPENCLGRHHFAYVPFSAGFRNCIGKRFAMMEMKTILSYVLRNFTVSSIDHRDKLNFVGDIILRPKEQIHLKFNKR